MFSDIFLHVIECGPTFDQVSSRGTEKHLRCQPLLDEYLDHSAWVQAEDGPSLASKSTDCMSGNPISFFLSTLNCVWRLVFCRRQGSLLTGPCCSFLQVCYCFIPCQTHVSHWDLSCQCGKRSIQNLAHVIWISLLEGFAWCPCLSDLFYGFCTFHLVFWRSAHGQNFCWVIWFQRAPRDKEESSYTLLFGSKTFALVRTNWKPCQKDCVLWNCQIRSCKLLFVSFFLFFFFFCVPQLYLWGSPLLGEIFAYVTVC